MLLAVAFFLGLQVETPVSAPLPDGFDAARKWKLHRSDGKEIPVQFRAGAAVWMDTPSDVEKSNYTLIGTEPLPSPVVECRSGDRSHLMFRFEDRDILRYNIGLVQPPPGVDPVYAFPGYVHPFWTPSGQAVTNDFSRGNEHQH